MDKSGKGSGKKRATMVIAAVGLFLALGVVISVRVGRMKQAGQGMGSVPAAQEAGDVLAGQEARDVSAGQEAENESAGQETGDASVVQESGSSASAVRELGGAPTAKVAEDAGQGRPTEGAGADVDYPARSFTSLCSYDGQVYCGTHGIFGEEIPVESNVFTIWDGKIYYVEKVQEAYDSLTDELTEIKRANMDGSSVEVLADDVFLAGAGYEKLAGDKLFYGYAYDGNHCMKYAWVDVNTKERGSVSTDRIESILGYDGAYLYYRGYDREKEQNVLGRVLLEEGRDEVLAAFAAVDEEGYIESVVYADGRLYCLTLAHKPEGYDYRTFVYRMEIRDRETGEVAGRLPVDFTGSANYSFLVQDGEVYTALAGEIVAVALADGEKRMVAPMEEGEYWGIMYFLPGDGYLYYEAIAETNEETGNNDYFYRVPAKGGEKELLKEWYTA